MSFYATAVTDPPYTERENQDSVIIQQKKMAEGGLALFAVVSDGMGERGQSASASVAKAFQEWFCRFCETPNADLKPESIQKSWDAIFQKITRRLYRELGDETGATAAVFMAVDGIWYMSNVGDVRVYEITDEGVKQLSVDHTYAAREIALGHMEATEALNDPKAFYVFQSLGKTKDIITSAAYGRIEPSASYIICTCGFYHQYRMGALYKAFRPGNIPENTEGLLPKMLDTEEKRMEDASVVLLLSSGSDSIEDEETTDAEEMESFFESKVRTEAPMEESDSGRKECEY